MTGGLVTNESGLGRRGLGSSLLWPNANERQITKGMPFHGRRVFAPYPLWRQSGDGRRVKRVAVSVNEAYILTRWHRKVLFRETAFAIADWAPGCKEDGGSEALERAIKEAFERLCALRDNWDGEGSPGYLAETIERAASLLRQQAGVLLKMGASFEVPYIQPGPAGSADLHWKTSERELLINVPADPAESITFYGDDYGEGVLKGAIEPGRAPVGLLLWPPKP